jgi:ribonuclease P protein component
LERKVTFARPAFRAGVAAMQRQFRLHLTKDIQRVRRTGKSYAHPLIVLIVAPGEPAQKRLAVSASRRVGGAVERNRVRRRVREAARPLMGSLKEGWDFLLLTRAGARTADFAELSDAVRSLFLRAGVLS